jgi:hypothetical protein
LGLIKPRGTSECSWNATRLFDTRNVGSASTNTKVLTTRQLI